MAAQVGADRLDPDSTAAADLAGIVRSLAVIRIVGMGVVFVGVVEAYRSLGLFAAIGAAAVTFSQPGVLIIVLIQCALSVLLLAGWNRLGPLLAASWWWPAAEGAGLLALLLTPCGSSTMSLLPMFVILMLLTCGGHRWGTAAAIATGTLLTIAVVTGLMGRMALDAADASDLHLQVLVAGQKSGLAAQVNTVGLAIAAVVAGIYAQKLALTQGNNRRLEGAALARRAVTLQRIRAAQEVHDSLASALSGAHLMATALQIRLAGRQDSPAVPASAGLVDTLQTAIDQSRTVLHELRESPPDSSPGVMSRSPIRHRPVNPAAGLRLSDMAMPVRVTSGVRLLSLILVASSPQSTLYHQTPSLLPLTVTVMVVLALFSVSFLLGWEGLGSKIAATWWWPAAEIAGTGLILGTCGPKPPVGTAVVAMILLLPLAAERLTAVVVPLALSIVAVLIITPILSWRGTGQEVVGQYHFTVYALFPLYLAVGVFARSIMSGQGEAAHGRIVAESRDAATDEQLRTAQEVRDRLLGSVALAREQAGALATSLSPDADPRSSELAAQLVTVLDAAQTDPAEFGAGLSDETPGDLTAACRNAVEKLSRQCPDIAVSAEFHAAVEAPASELHDLDRALSELLENVRRHSQATAVKVTLRQSGTDIEIEVADNGVGLPEDTNLEQFRQTGHFGLAGVKERLARINGHLVLEPANPGTRATLVVPGP